MAVEQFMIRAVRVKCPFCAEPVDIYLLQQEAATILRGGSASSVGLRLVTCETDESAPQAGCLMPFVVNVDVTDRDEVGQYVRTISATALKIEGQ